MEQKIVDNANKYKRLATELAGMEVDRSMDDDIPEDVQAALLRLYYAKALEIEIEKCEDLLDEDTDEETVNAVTEAASAIDAASESAFGDVESYALKDAAFAQRVEEMTVSTETNGLLGSLIKLYKCEGIIRYAYRCSMKFPLYGTPTGQLGLPQETDSTTDAEEEIMKTLGVNIYELLELRERLVKEITSLVGNVT
jgi:hypothetical protein